MLAVRLSHLGVPCFFVKRWESAADAPHRSHYPEGAAERGHNIEVGVEQGSAPPPPLFLNWPSQLHVRQESETVITPDRYVIFTVKAFISSPTALDWGT